MAYTLNGMGRKVVKIDFIVIIVIGSLMVLVSTLLLLSAVILAPAALFRSRMSDLASH
jgi:hypothetical protein